MAGHEVNFRDLDTHIKTAILQELAKMISTEWSFVGRYLRLSDATLSYLESNYRGNQLRVNYEMLNEWAQSADRAITTNVFLATALKAAGRADLHEWVMKNCK